MSFNIYSGYLSVHSGFNFSDCKYVKQAMARLEEGYVQARSDNLPKIDAYMLMEFASKAVDFIAAEIRNIKSDRSMRDSYVSCSVGRVSLRRDKNVCVIKAQVCPEHKQHSPNYKVSMAVDEDEETITYIKCFDCAASEGGCKHSLALLMWAHLQSSKPSPTDVESYWCKPKLSNISSTRVATVADFGSADLPVRKQNKVDPKKFLLSVTSLDAVSTFQRYHSAIDRVTQLDLHLLCIEYVKSRGYRGPCSATDFLNFCQTAMTDQSCKEAFHSTQAQSESRQWNFLRYGRISASILHDVAHSKKEEGGVLVEYILGATKLKMTRAMQRGKTLESEVLGVVKQRLGLKSVLNVGVKLSPEFPEFGASPDGLTDEHVIEIKCPIKEKTVKNYIKNNNVVAPKYMAQMQLQMKFCCRTKALFCVAAPDFEETKEVTILSVDFDPELIASLMEQGRRYWEKNVFPILLAAARK